MSDERAINKFVSKPLSLGLGFVGGLAAGVVFKGVWKLLTNESEVPRADDLDRGIREVLAAAALHGAIFAIVKALIERGSVIGARKLTFGD